jgi:hypothetical protein
MDVLFYACTFVSIDKYLDINIFKSKDLGNPKN